MCDLQSKNEKRIEGLQKVVTKLSNKVTEMTEDKEITQVIQANANFIRENEKSISPQKTRNAPIIAA